MKDPQKITSAALRYWLRKTGMKQGELAEKTGISQGHISNMATGSRGMPTASLEKICEALEITIPEFFACEDSEAPDIVFVPLVAARPRAGNGGLETDGKHVKLYAFHSTFLDRKRGSADTMRLFEVDGDSMEPTLRSGDMVMVNTTDSARHVATGNIYLLRIGEELMLKRLENRPGGVLLIKSDNESYEDIPVNFSEMDGDIEIFGRMVWSCREY